MVERIGGICFPALQACCGSHPFLDVFHIHHNLTIVSL